MQCWIYLRIIYTLAHTMSLNYEMLCCDIYCHTKKKKKIATSRLNLQVIYKFNHAVWAMDLLVPCIVEGRSELRNVGRVNCKTHWPFFKGLRNTLLTERSYRFAEFLSVIHFYVYTDCSVLGWECFNELFSHNIILTQRIHTHEKYTHTYIIHT